MDPPSTLEMWVRLHELDGTYVVATLALGLQRCGPKMKHGSHISCSQECRRVWGNEPPHSQVNSQFGSWSPDGLLNLQRAILGVKTHWIEEFFYHYKFFAICMLKMGSNLPFGYLKHKLWPKERPIVKLSIWLPTIKSQESPWFICVHVAWNILLKSSWWGLQLYFRPHFNWRSVHKIMGLQSYRSPNLGNFETPTWESRDNSTFGC
jgi:hypothetical protein